MMKMQPLVDEGGAVVVDKVPLKITDLPPEMISKIIGYLENSSRFALRSVSTCLRNHVDTTLQAEGIPDHCIPWNPFFDNSWKPSPGKIILVNQGQCKEFWKGYQEVRRRDEMLEPMPVKGFVIWCWYENKYPVLKQLVRHFGEELQTLCIRHNGYAKIDEIFKRTPNLEHFSMYVTSYAKDSPVDHSRLPEMPNLKSFTFIRCRNRWTLALLTKYSKKIQRLTLEDDGTVLWFMLSVLTRDAQGFMNLLEFHVGRLKSPYSIKLLIQVTSKMAECKIKRFTLKLTDGVNRNVPQLNQLKGLQRIVRNLSKNLEELHVETRLTLTIDGCILPGMWRAFSITFPAFKTLHVHVGFLLSNPIGFLNHLQIFLPAIKQLVFIRWNEVSPKNIRNAKLFIRWRGQQQQQQNIPLRFMMPIVPLNQLDRLFEPFWRHLGALEGITVLKYYNPAETVYNCARNNWN